ncbi:NADP-dependent oxidoreductase [Prauserella sp. PE36]|uniref:NADP-dependent oxidoreductase n=1 Tax=Prauserella endophytica TaxID=1592324 RepID=A0ABY2S600_9PSEU|nr:MULTISPECIES: NADP-dependent oxidoreductase [Prauserella]RBM16216.1 NADP-dependent oxidoreductase [Prauserella sp. PE36]TKG70811.1 NADP-dependent oxidoreductase [Prauserella endophytica]
MTPGHGAEVRLVRRPVGTPVADDFEVGSVRIAEPREGEVVVRNEYLSVDPYMRGRMIDAKSYIEPFALGEVMSGGAVGTVVRSEAPELPVGETVLHDHGWREYAVAPAADFTRVDTTVAPASAYLGILGMPGQTAYFGLFDVAGMRPGDTVFISGAAGAVGSLAGQFARLRGARRVIGSAGSPEKVAYLRDELGFDAAFDYHDGPVREQLRAAAPGGIDVYFDNVGGDHLRAAIGAIRPFGRITLCGAISGYNDTRPPPGPDNLILAVGKRLTLRGFVVYDFADRTTEFEAQVGRWLLDGHVRLRETVVSGVHNATTAFLGLFDGANTGKMLVRV